MTAGWRPPKGFALGLVVGVILTVVAGLLLRPRSPGASEAQAAEGGTDGAEFESPWADVPAERRVFTLSLNNPDVVAADEDAHMRADDLVIGVLVRNSARAYPWWIASNFHVMNDMIASVPVYVAVCEVCTGASAFRAQVRERPQLRLSFEHSGVHGGTFEVSDLETLSQWHPFTGTARGGPLAGSRMSKIATFLERWSEWKRLRPDTDVVLGSEHLRRRPHGAREGQLPGDDYMPPVFGLTARFDDGRLRPNALVYGLVSDDGEARLAVPLDRIPDDGVLSLDVGSTPVLLYRRGDLRIHAFVRWVDGEALTFEIASEDPLRLRDQNGSLWDAWGRGLEGPARGAAMEPARGYVTEWYEWSTAEPNAKIHEPAGSHPSGD